MKTARFLTLLCVLWVVFPQIVFAEMVQIIGPPLQVNSVRDILLQNDYVEEKDFSITEQSGLKVKCDGNPKNQCPGIQVFVENQQQPVTITILDETAREEGMCEPQWEKLKKLLPAKKKSKETKEPIDCEISVAKEGDQFLLKWSSSNAKRVSIGAGVHEPSGQKLIDLDVGETTISALFHRGEGDERICPITITVPEEDVPLVTKPSDNVVHLIFNAWQEGSCADPLWCDYENSQSRNLSDEILSADNRGDCERYQNEISLRIRFYGTGDDKFTPADGRRNKSFLNNYTEYTISVVNGKAIMTVDQRWLGNGKVKITVLDKKTRYPSPGHSLNTFKGELVPRGDDNEANFHFVIAER